MKHIKIETNINLPKNEVWKMFVNPKSYVKYFKYIHGVYYKGEMKLGFRWFDLATVVYFPAIVMHVVTKFEKEKTLEFVCPFPFIGKIIERVDLEEKQGKTFIKAEISYDYGPILGLLFNKVFEERFTFMLNDGIKRAKADLER